MKQIVLLFLLLLTNLSFSQTVTVKGRVYDFEKKGIKMAKIVYGVKNENFTFTDSKGYYIFEIEKSKLDSISFKHSLQQNKTITITNRYLKKIKQDTLTINVLLNDFELGVIEVGVKKPDTLFGTQAYSIADYEITPSGGLLLLTYSKSQKKSSKLRLLNKDLEEVTSYLLLEQTIELKTDFRNNIHLITRDKIYLIAIDNDRIRVHPEDKDYFYKYVAPIVDTLQDRLYYSNFSELYPAFDYMEFNKTDSVYKKMLEVKDEPLMEQYRSEYKFSDVRTKLWAHNKQIETGIDKEVWVGAAVFTQSVYYTPLYAPLFVADDTVFIFDHYDNELIKYTPKDEVVSTTSIEYHFNSKKSGWEQPLIQDKKGGKIYAIFSRNGYTFLSYIDTNSGKTIKTIKLYYKYIEQIKIIDNKVYYIYRPYESIQKKYIYKENLNFN